MELKQRREFHYPLYRYLIRHIFRGRNVDKVAFFADKWVEALEKVIDVFDVNPVDDNKSDAEQALSVPRMILICSLILL